jgi:hypothetical protein
MDGKGPVSAENAGIHADSDEVARCEMMSPGAGGYRTATALTLAPDHHRSQRGPGLMETFRRAAISNGAPKA